MAWKGGHLIAVPPSKHQPYVSVLRSYRQRKPSGLKRISNAVRCGYEANADVVGAINILRAGHARFACEVNDGRRQQQEPTEATQAMASCHA